MLSNIKPKKALTSPGPAQPGSLARVVRSCGTLLALGEPESRTLPSGCQIGGWWLVGRLRGDFSPFFP
jgi:hypothetical protein